MPYALSRKQLDRLSKGHPLSVALPPHLLCIDAFDNWTLKGDKLIEWATEQLPGLGRAKIERAYLTTIWLDCERNADGLTGYFGAIVPDITRHSMSGLPPIPVSVVVCEIVPTHDRHVPMAGITNNIQWPLEYVSPTGFGFGGKHEERFAPASNIQGAAS